MQKIAVLLTCHNRKDKTLGCLNNFFKAKKPKNLSFDIFLVDDGSTDGTSCEIRLKFPNINVIEGTGSLFWNQGMRLAWAKAIENAQDYDFFLWLNDDTFIYHDSVMHLIECYNEYKKNNSKEAIVVAACSEDKNSKLFSYGLRGNQKPIIPNGKIQNGDMMNGNLVLIKSSIHKKVGMLSNNYTHAMGDYDYGLRAIRFGIDLITTKKFVATCESNKSIPVWCNPEIPLMKRWRSLHTPLGLNIDEYKLFRKRFWPDSYLISMMKIYFRCFFPFIYAKIKTNEI